MEKDKVYEILNEAYFGANPHEAKSIASLPALVNGPMVVVDVGASLGQYSLASARLLEGGKVVGIEADPIRFEELERNYSKWSSEYGVEMMACHAVASDRTTPMTFHTSNSNISGGVDPDVKGHAGEDVVWTEVSVDGIVLDQLAAELGSDPDLIKMDIEGGEAHAIPGCEQILKRGTTVFLIELHPDVKVGDKTADQIVMSLMAEHGYGHLPYFGKYLFAKNLKKQFASLVWRYRLRRLARKVLSPLRGTKKNRP